MNVVEFCVGYLHIKRPFKIHMLSSANEKFDAVYWPRYSDKKGNLTHDIKIYLGNNNRSIDALIAHEFIHAWQEEFNVKEYHGPEFIRHARFIEKALILKGVYIPEYDSEEPKVK